MRVPRLRGKAPRCFCFFFTLLVIVVSVHCCLLIFIVVCCCCWFFIVVWFALRQTDPYGDVPGPIVLRRQKAAHRDKGSFLPPPHPTPNPRFRGGVPILFFSIWYCVFLQGVLPRTSTLEAPTMLLTGHSVIELPISKQLDTEKIRAKNRALRMHANSTARERCWHREDKTNCSVPTRCQSK